MSKQVDQLVRKYLVKACPECGYDMGSPVPTERCPECGLWFGKRAICFLHKVQKWNPLALGLLLLFGIVTIYGVYTSGELNWCMIVSYSMFAFSAISYFWMWQKDPYMTDYLLLTESGIVGRARGHERGELRWETIEEVCANSQMQSVALKVRYATPPKPIPITLSNLSLNDIARFLTFRWRRPMPAAEQETMLHTPEGVSLEDFVAILQRYREARGTEWFTQTS